MTTRTLSSARARGLVALVVVAALSLIGCSSDSPASPGSPDSSDSSAAPGQTDTSTAEGETAARDLWGGTRFDPLAEGDFDDLALLKDTKKPLAPYDEGSGYAAPVFGDDTIVLLPESLLLTVLEPDTAEVRWQQRVPELERYPGAGKEPPELCRVAQLPPGATVVTVVLGDDCNLFLHYDLESGDLVDQEQRVDDLGLSEFTPTFSVGRETYWIDVDSTIYRFNGAGGSELVLGAGELELTSDRERAFRTTVINGTDVVVLDVVTVGSDRANSGRFIGVRMDEDGGAEVLWDQPTRRLIEQAEPGGRYLDQDAVLIPEFGGHLYTNVQRGVLTPRVNRFDPETGVLDTGLILEQDPPGGIPGWAILTGVDNVLPLEDGILAASGYQDSDDNLDITFYDYTTGKIRWTHRPKTDQDFGSTRSDPVGVSSDGSSYYVAVLGDSDSELHELDAATGRETRRWEFPLAVTSFLTDSFGVGLEMVVDGDRMVWMSRSVTRFNPYFAAVFTLPGAE